MSYSRANGKPGALDRIVTRVAVVTVLAGITAAALGAALVGMQARGALGAEMEQRNAARASLLAIRIDTRVGTLETILAAAARQGDVIALDASSSTALRSLLTAVPAFDEMVLYGGDGEPVAAAAERFLADTSDYPPRPNLAETVERGTVIEIIPEFPPLLRMNFPVEDPPGNFRGILSATTPLELVASILEQLDPTIEATQILTDGDGRILVHPARDLIAESAQYDVEAIYQDSPHQDLVTRDGVEWMIASAPVTTFDGVVMVEQNTATAFAPVNDQLLALILTVIGVTLVSVLAVAVTTRRLVRPLGPISRAIERLGTGEHGVRLVGPRSGELADLAGSVNEMAESLDRRRDELTHMHHFSRLVISRADREAVATEVVEGAHQLMDATATFLHELDEDGETRVVNRMDEQGRLSDVPVSQLARCAETGSTNTTLLDRGETALMVPIVGIGGDVTAILTVILDGRDPSSEEIGLLETFASFAGVAFENVHRLELEQQLVHELQQTVDARNDLTRNITHDLRVPIAAITSFASRLREEWASETAHREELLQQIEEQAGELDEMVMKLLEFATPETEKRTLTMAPTPLRPCVRAALDALAPMIQSRPIDNAVPNLYVKGDHVALTRTLVHLLSNAIRHSPFGAPVRIAASAHEDDLVRVDVVDQGSGIAPDDVHRIFQPFWRKPSGAADQLPGTGLGLALAAEYVDAMGGEIGVESEPHEGSTFFFTLPAADPHPSEASIGNDDKSARNDL